MSQLEPATQAFIDSLAGAPPLYTLSPEAARNVLAGAQKSVPVTLAPARSDDRVLNVGPKGRTEIRIYRPENAEGTLPVVIYTHGGGWVLGDRETHDRLVRELTVGANAVVVFVDYDRSPENRYPIAVEESYAVLKYVTEHPDEFGADTSRIAIAGDSVGGNMTAAVALLAKERNGPSVKAQLLFYPVTDASMSTGSYQEFAEGPWLTKKAMEWFWDQYLPDVSKRSDIHVSPINASSEQLKGLPQTLLLVDENDVLRDEGEAYGRKLAAAGVRSGRFATMARSTTSCCSTRSRKRRRCVALSIRRQIICVRSSPTDDGDLEAIMRGEVMKIVVIGGTGLIGSKVVEKLRQKGHEAIAAAPNTGVNTITGEGLKEAMAGAQVVIDLANSPSFEDKAVLEFFETSGRNLLAAEAAASVRHHVALSIVGIDRSDNGYFRAKVAQENLIKTSGIPYTIVRSTQFMEFLRGIVASSADGNMVRISPGLFQPIAAEDVAAIVADVALAAPRNGIVEIAGPERAPFNEIVARYLKAVGDPRKVVSDREARYFGGPVEEHSLVPLGEARLGRIGFDEWLRRSQTAA